MSEREIASLIIITDSIMQTQDTSYENLFLKEVLSNDIIVYENLKSATQIAVVASDYLIL